MNELNSFIVRYNGKFIRVYEESEVDAAITELKEFAEDACLERDDNQTAIDELNAENSQLKMSIGKLLKAKTEQVMDEVFQKCLIYGEGFVPVEHAMKLVAELRNNKYKRCLAMAKWCESEAYIHEHGSEYDEGLVAWFGKWYNIWMKLAKKFKEAEHVRIDSGDGDSRLPSCP